MCPDTEANASERHATVTEWQCSRATPRNAGDENSNSVSDQLRRRLPFADKGDFITLLREVQDDAGTHRAHIVVQTTAASLEEKKMEKQARPLREDRLRTAASVLRGTTHPIHQEREPTQILTCTACTLTLSAPTHPRNLHDVTLDRNMSLPTRVTAMSPHFWCLRGGSWCWHGGQGCGQLGAPRNLGCRLRLLEETTFEEMLLRLVVSMILRSGLAKVGATHWKLPV